MPRQVRSRGGRGVRYLQNKCVCFMCGSFEQSLVFLEKATGIRHCSVSEGGDGVDIGACGKRRYDSGESDDRRDGRGGGRVNIHNMYDKNRRVFSSCRAYHIISYHIVSYRIICRICRRMRFSPCGWNELNMSQVRNRDVCVCLFNWWAVSASSTITMTKTCLAFL